MEEKYSNRKIQRILIYNDDYNICYACEFVQTLLKQDRNLSDDALVLAPVQIDNWLDGLC